MIKLNPCPHCAVDGIESYPRVGLEYGMYGLIATCECRECGNATWEAVDHGHFIPEDEVDRALEKVKREWNRK